MRAVNLLPAQRRTTVSLSSWKSIRPGHIIAVVLAALAVMAVMYGTARSRAQTSEAEAAAVQAQVAAAKRVVTADSAIAAAIPASEQAVSAAAKVANARFAWTPLLHQLATHVPAGVQFTAMTVTLSASGSGSITRVEKPEPGTAVGATLVLNGCSHGQRQVAALMRALRAVSNVSEVTLQSSIEPIKGSAGGGSTGGCPKSGPVFAMTATLVPPKASSAPLPTRAVLASHANPNAKGTK
ncbi:MAG TPA: PilN domain-containing protein [Solirubrobacteraceae bacterium]|nr:PilN domain-containing protein [Solirubrobacteraceae bacterium]